MLIEIIINLLLVLEFVFRVCFVLILLYFWESSWSGLFYFEVFMLRVNDWYRKKKLNGYLVLFGIYLGLRLNL